MGGVDDHPELVRLPELTAETFSVNAVSPAVTGRAFSNIDGSQGISHWEATYDRFANWFWRVTIAPLLDHIGYGRRPITVVPIGRLIGAPWTSAWTRSDDARSGRRYLPDRLDIRFAPNARVLSRERQAVQREELNLLAVTASGASGTQPLKYGNAELAAAMSGIAATKALTQESATREAIMGEIRGRTAIHICCHGSADALQPLDSFLLVGSDERITMRDLLSVRLDGMEMVMLSACETGVHGDLLPDEAMGLASAILAAGSRACIAASWPIPDLATAMLAYRFHYEWRHAKFDPGAALIRSQLWLREPRTKRSTRTSSKRPLSRMGTRQRRQ
jgi:CHAT domain-containing protein